MAIDPRIILSGQRDPVRINTPFENLDLVMQAEQRQQAVRANEAKLRAEERAARQQAQIQQILQQTQGDWEVALPQIRRVAPEASLQYEKMLGDARKERAAALKTEIDADAALTDKWIGRLRGLPEGDDELYQLYRQRITQEMPDLGAQLPPTYDKAALDRVQQVGLTAKEYADLQRQSLEFAAKGEWRQSTGAALATATSADDWDQILAGQRELGAPKAVLAQFGPWAPNAPQRARQLGMTASQQALSANTATDNDRQERTLAETQRHNRVMETRPTSSGSEPLVAVQGPDGQPVLLPRSQAAGMRPASDRQNAGARGVTSGDANRIADFDTSLSDVRVLRNEIGTTGTASKIEAMAPNWVSDLTGFGAEAKGRQAVIDRVKQVIGKALEGGVLRKEDEYKYTKILPTIGDPPSVAKTKLDGLEKALIERRQTLMDSLNDAGYDVSRYESRGGGQAPPPPNQTPNRTPIGGRQGVEVEAPNGKVYTFPNQAQADVFKKRAGIP